jgi:hypothetical protein
MRILIDECLNWRLSRQIGRILGEIAAEQGISLLVAVVALVIVPLLLMMVVVAAVAVLMVVLVLVSTISNTELNDQRTRSYLCVRIYANDFLTRRVMKC